MAEMSNKKNANVINSGNKPKKSKNDIFRATIGLYLKQKNYVARKSDKLQNKKQFVLQKMLESDLSVGGNCFAFSNVLCITNNQNIVDQQFCRFSTFVESQNEVIRIELRRFYGPMLCHLYVELMKAREPRAAVDLFRKYAHLVAPVDSYDAPLPTKINGCSLPNIDAHNDLGVGGLGLHSNIRFVREANAAAEDPELDYFIKLIQTLSVCTNLESAENDTEVAHFRSSKYEIHTTEAVIDALLSYLEKRGHVLILNLLYTWIHVHIIDNEVRQWTEDNLLLGAEEDDDEEESTIAVQQEQKSKNHITTKRPADDEPAAVKAEKVTSTPVAVVDTDEEKKGRGHKVRTCLVTLRESKEQIAKTQTEFPRFIKLADNGRGLTSADLDANECHLVAGFNSSVVQLWQMNQHTNRGKNLYRRADERACRWELNNCEPEEDNEIEVEMNSQAADTKSDRHKRKFDQAKYEGNSYDEFGGIQLRGHGSGVTDVRFSTHYPLIYSVSKDATMRCWRAESYSCAAVYRGHRYPIWCMDESPVGMYVATGSKDLTARLWSLEREFPVITYAGHTQDVECLAFHPNGNYIATGSADLSVRLWCVTSGKLMRVFSDCKQPVTSIAFSPDGKMLAVGGEETKIRIFDLAAGTQLNELKEHSASVSSLAWNSNGKQLASVCRDGSLRLWDVKKLSPMHESSSTTSTSSSASSNRIMAVNSICQRLVKVFYSRDNTISCMGS